MGGMGGSAGGGHRYHHGASGSGNVSGSSNLSGSGAGDLSGRDLDDGAHYPLDQRQRQGELHPASTTHSRPQPHQPQQQQHHSCDDSAAPAAPLLASPSTNPLAAQPGGPSSSVRHWLPGAPQPLSPPSVSIAARTAAPVYSPSSSSSPPASSPSSRGSPRQLHLPLLGYPMALPPGAASPALTGASPAPSSPTPSGSDIRRQQSSQSLRKLLQQQQQQQLQLLQRNASVSTATATANAATAPSAASAAGGRDTSGSVASYGQGSPRFEVGPGIVGGSGGGGGWLTRLSPRGGTLEASFGMGNVISGGDGGSGVGLFTSSSTGAAVAADGFIMRSLSMEIAAGMAAATAAAPNVRVHAHERR